MAQVLCPACASPHVVRFGATGFSCLLCGGCWLTADARAASQSI